MALVLFLGLSSLALAHSGGSITSTPTAILIATATATPSTLELTPTATPSVVIATLGPTPTAVPVVATTLHGINTRLMEQSMQISMDLKFGFITQAQAGS